MFPHTGPAPAAAAATPAAERDVYFSSAAKPLKAKIYRRETLSAGAAINGPALIQEHGTTTVLFENDLCRLADTGELIITVGGTR